MSGVRIFIWVADGDGTSRIWIDGMIASFKGLAGVTTMQDL